MLTLLCSTTPAWATPQAADPGDAVDSDWVLRTLARPAPMRANFVEFRDSPLLKAPLRISGEYQRPDEATLVREVRTPYTETTTIRGGEASIARPGRTPRKFALSRVPELAGLQASFGALLSGDRDMLGKFYGIETSGTRHHWTMTLQPRHAPLSARVRNITLYGRGIELRCIETLPVRGKEVQRTLLASAAREAGDVVSAEALTALCRGSAQ